MLMLDKKNILFNIQQSLNQLPTAAIKNLILFKFLISHLVPKGVPISCTDTFTSHRNDP